MAHAIATGAVIAALVVPLAELGHVEHAVLVAVGVHVLIVDRSLGAVRVVAVAEISWLHAIASVSLVGVVTIAVMGILLAVVNSAVWAVFVAYVHKVLVMLRSHGAIRVIVTSIASHSHSWSTEAASTVITTMAVSLAMLDAAESAVLVAKSGAVLVLS